MNGLELLRAIEDGLDIVPRPFEAVAAKLGSDEREVLDALGRMLVDGTIRSFRAVMNHMALGLTVNAMIAWDVPDAEVERAAEAFAGVTEVSHCYERRRVPGKWRHNLFTMVHASSEDELERFVQEGRRIVPGADFIVLRTLKEYKKTGVKV